MTSALVSVREVFGLSVIIGLVSETGFELSSSDSVLRVLTCALYVTHFG